MTIFILFGLSAGVINHSTNLNLLRPKIYYTLAECNKDREWYLAKYKEDSSSTFICAERWIQK